MKFEASWQVSPI